MVVRKISKQLSSRLMKMQRTCLRRLCHPHFLKEKSLTLSRRRRSCCSKLTSRSKTRWSLSGPLMNKVKIPWLHLIRAAERTTCRLSSQRLEMKPWSSLLKRVLSLPRNWQVGSWQVLSRFNNCFQLRNSMDLRTHAHSKPPSRHTDKPLTLRKRHHSFLKNCKASSKVSREELVRKDYKPCRPEWNSTETWLKTLFHNKRSGNTVFSQMQKALLSRQRNTRTSVTTLLWRIWALSFWRMSMLSRACHV